MAIQIPTVFREEMHGFANTFLAKMIFYQKLVVGTLALSSAGILASLFFFFLKEEHPSEAVELAFTEVSSLDQIYRSIALNFMAFSPIYMQYSIVSDHLEPPPDIMKQTNMRIDAVEQDLTHLKEMLNRWMKVPKDGSALYQKFVKELKELQDHIHLFQGLVRVHNLQAAGDLTNARVELETLSKKEQRLLGDTVDRRGLADFQVAHVREENPDFWADLSLVYLVFSSLLDATLFMRRARTSPYVTGGDSMLAGLVSAEFAMKRRAKHGVSVSMQRSIKQARALILTKLGRFDEAVLECEQALQLQDPLQGSATRESFILFLVAGKVLTAQVTARHTRLICDASLRQPERSQSQTHTAIEKATNEIKKDEVAEKAVRYLTRAIMLHPTASLPYALRGRVLRLRGDLELARSDLEYAFKHSDAQTDEVIRGLLFLNLQENRCEEARGLFDLSLLLAEANPSLCQHRRAVVQQFEKDYGTNCLLSEQTNINSRNSIPLIKKMHPKTA